MPFSRVKVWLARLSGNATAAIVFAGFLPGALAGTQMAGLLFFLNPHLSFTPGPLLRGIAVYGSLLGGVSLALHLPFTWGRPERARRALPWTLSIVFATAALIDWVHASYYAYYLPIGINKRLIKAAFWLSLVALVCFYTALLHTLHRRAYRAWTRIGLGVIAVLSIYVMVERREAFDPLPREIPRPSAVEFIERPTLLVVGLEGATLDAILPLAEQGRLPFLANLMQRGVHGHLKSLEPTRRSSLWTTLSTGKYPYRHGVLTEEIYPAGFLEPGADLYLLPAGIGFGRWGSWGPRRMSHGGETRSVVTLWEILSRAGIPTAVVGWPAVEPVPQELVAAYSDAFFRGHSGPRYLLPSDSVEHSQALKPSPESLSQAMLSKFGPGAPEDLRLILVQDLWRESLTLSLLDQAPPVEAVFVGLPGLLTLSQRYFGGYMAVQFDGVQDPAHQRAAQVLTAYYVHLDELLERLWDRLPKPRLLVVASAYGTRGPEGWSKIWAMASREGSLTGSFEGAPDGVLLLQGEGLEGGTFLSLAELTDLAPTLLYGLGLPVGRDLDGRVLTQGFEAGFLVRNPLRFVPSYETLTHQRPGSR